MPFADLNEPPVEQCTPDVEVFCLSIAIGDPIVL
jgi:hypothetical protein